MNIKIMTSLCVISFALSSQAAADQKTGFYLGLGGGYKHHQVTQEAKFKDTTGMGAFADDESFKRKGNKNSVSTQVQSGYNYFFNKIFTALEINYRFNPSNNIVQINSNQADFFPSQPPFIMRQRHQHDVGLALHGGGLTGDNFIAYAIANLRLGKFRQQFINPKSNLQHLISGSTKQNRLGYGGGVGLQYGIKDGFSLATEATYDIYKKLVIKQNLATSGYTLNAKSNRPQMFNLILKASKTF